MPSSEQELQRQYYESTATRYDAAHVHGGDEHHFALAFLVGMLEFIGANSVLEVGAGTGRALSYLKDNAPQVQRLGIEPVAALRDIAYGKGVASDELVCGDGARLAFADRSFDVVCEFGMLHHVRDHAQVVQEMLRVSSKAILISDCNNFGQGGALIKAIKQGLHATRLWGIANLMKTRGRGYSITEGDGLAYSYSVFSDYSLIRAHCKSVHVLNTLDAGVNPYRSASHVALLGIK